MKNTAVVLDLVQEEGTALQYASDERKNYPDVVLAAVQLNYQLWFNR